MGTVLSVLQVIASLLLIVLILMQTTKSEQSGGTTGMGWGVIGGKSASSLHTPWGVEQHLERITKYVAIGFMVVSFAAAVVMLRAV